MTSTDTIYTSEEAVEKTEREMYEKFRTDQRAKGSRRRTFYPHVTDYRVWVYGPESEYEAADFKYEVQADFSESFAWGIDAPRAEVLAGHLREAAAAAKARTPYYIAVKFNREH